MSRTFYYILQFFIIFLVAGCTGSPFALSPTPTATPDDAPPPALRLALPPIADSIPFYVAEAQGYFEEEGVAVELFTVESVPDRDILFQSGEVDGMLTDLVSTVVLNAGEGAKLTIVRQARVAFDDEPMYFVVSGPDSGITAVEQLADQEIGILENSAIEYYTDRLLVREGLAPEEINTTDVPQVPARLQLLMEGQLPVAVLPDTLAALAALQGGTIVISDAAYPTLSQSVIAFGRDHVETRPEEIGAIIRAFDRAVEDINADRLAFQKILVEHTALPELLEDSYQLPRYPLRSLPTQEQIDDVISWAQEESLLGEAPPYDELVTQQFTP